jgi:predicted RecB family nuclease
MTTKQLTKTLIKSAVDCQKRLYYELNSPDLKKHGEDAFFSHLAAEGYKFEKIAVTLFQDVKKQEIFTSNNVQIRTDVIDENLTEIKSSTSITDEHLLDVAIQAQILSELNINVEKYQLAYVNKDYVRTETITPKKFIKITDVTKEVYELLPEAKLLIEKCRKTATLNKSPKKECGKHCLECPFLNHCSPELLEYSIFNLRRGGDKIDELLAGGIKHLKDIPSFAKLSPFQQLQVEAESKKIDIIDKEKIKKILKTLRYPIWYLDFEAAPILVPQYKGCSPYEQITFQVSIHVQETSDTELKHLEFLHDKNTDPRYDLTLFLNMNVGDIGSVVVYHASYEKARLSEMAKKYPKFSYKLNTMIDRLWDLETIFTKGHYLSSKFEGSTSIKKILPVLVPSLSYKDLNISNGADAFISYLQMIEDKTTSGKKREIYNSLLQYCQMDTYAMYAIVEALKEVCHD